MSLQYAAVIAISVALGISAQHHSGRVIRACFFIVAFIPYASTGVVFNSPDLPEAATVHPVTFIVLVAGARWIVTNRDLARALLMRYRFVVWSGLLLVGAGVWWTLRSRGHLPGPILVDQVVIPLGLFLWVRSRIENVPSEGTALPRFLVLVGAGEALLAVAGVVLHFQSVWGFQTDFGRQAATVNGPLPLALVLMTCIPLSVTIRSSAARLGIVVLLLAGILTTQSRSALVVGVMCACFVIFAGRASVGSRVIVLLTAPIIVLAILQSTFVSGVASRFADDLGSAMLRSTAADYFWSNLRMWLVSGQGVGSSYTVARSAGLQSSFESAFYMYSVDFGFLVTVIGFGLLLLQLLVGRPWSTTVRNGGFVAAVACFILVQGYSSIATESMAGALLWVVIAFGVHAPYGRDSAGPVGAGLAIRPSKVTRLGTTISGR